MGAAEVVAKRFGPPWRLPDVAESVNSVCIFHATVSFAPKAPYNCDVWPCTSVQAVGVLIVSWCGTAHMTCWMLSCRVNVH